MVMKRLVVIISMFSGLVAVPLHANKKDITRSFLSKEKPKQKEAVQKPSKEGLPATVQEEYNLDSKKADAQKLVEKAKTFFDKTTLARACKSFINDPHWRKGEIFIFLFGEDGYCYVNGNDREVIWQKLSYDNQLSSKASSGRDIASVISDMLEVGQDGGWISYVWHNASQKAYVHTVQKGDKRYILGAGFYPDSARFDIQYLVEEAIRYGEKNGASLLFAQINNPAGQFVKGDAYLWVYDLEGNAYAHGRNLAVVGQNRLDWSDSKGRYRNRTMIDLVKKQGSGWIVYDEVGVEKYGFVKSFTDARTEKTFIVGGGYYPFIDQDVVQRYVKRGINYLKANGTEVAFRDFTSYTGGFFEGPLRIFVYSLDGTVLADAENPSFIGQNLLNSRDAEGKYIVKALLEVANTKGQGWITFLDKDSYKELYVEKVSVPDGNYVIGAGYWPSSKSHTAQALAEKAVVYFNNHTLTECLQQFTEKDNDFLRGDLIVSVYDSNGICLAHGYDKTRIWTDLNNIFDAKGRPVASSVISTALAGGGWVEYPLDNAIYKTYVKQVYKNTAKGTSVDQKAMSNRYVIGVGYYK